MNRKITLQSFKTNKFYDIELITDSTIEISVDNNQYQFKFDKRGNSLKIKELDYVNDEITLIAIEASFSFFPEEITEISFNQSSIRNRNDLKEYTEGEFTTLPRMSFSSLGDVWAKRNSCIQEEIIKTGNISHPKRPTYFSGELLYKKYFPLINKTISFRVIDLEKDLDNFHQWHNKEFIYNFWELNKSKEELSQYLENALKDPHSIPAILEFNNEPVGYFEFYWVKEDRLGPFFNFSDHDRGFHFLIGEESCLGIKNVDSILKATSHYAFLNDTRTKLLAGEPRSDNKRIIRYTDHFECWRNEKEFDFPHKRAALLLCDRETYFKEGYPWI
ncbi:GNAT family N-acetyltransferase [Halobacteriovorax sp. JY17]|uniref:GNAT family N-acetyltransferase n=1 Tax=Halobacteriovorax sp. JY17 TaxID=2014617 RepID=UPI000C4E6639|nr:GNAT family N-acetyltransferase [Halobacteriovorax sp. JY17]PIK14876.1 MAG: hypothetical protein CES88_11125 [Halobacteriovorax sp. JY17]